jgi:hypothetical protein
MKGLWEVVGIKLGKVPLTGDVSMKCRCELCPVQGISACSTPQVKKMIDSRAEVYCSVGLADCKDLDNTKQCICNQCQVYADFNLADSDPKDYFCFNGKVID